MGTAHSACVADLDDGGVCGRDGVPNAPLSLCGRHLIAVFEFCHNTISGLPATEVRDRLTEERRLRELDEDFVAERYRTYRPVVYYVRVGDRIKIGTTVNLTSRLHGYPPGSELLATESGSYELEAARHREFEGFRCAGKEWFTPGARLLAHIDTLREAAAVA